MEKEQRSITLIPNQAPAIVGEWTVGEILQMLQSGIQWIQSIPLGIPPTAEIEESKSN